MSEWINDRLLYSPFGFREDAGKRYIISLHLPLTIYYGVIRKKMNLSMFLSYDMMYLCVFAFQDLLERAEWGADLPTVENNLQEHNAIHTAVEELMSSLQEARSYEVHKFLPSTRSQPPVY